MRFRIFPLILITVGLVFLLVNLGVVPRETLHHFLHTWWPLLLIAIGGALLLRPRGCCNGRCGHHHKSDPSSKNPGAGQQP